MYSTVIFVLSLHSSLSLLWGNHYKDRNPKDPQFMQLVWAGIYKINDEPQGGLWHIIPVKLLKVRSESTMEGTQYQFDVFARESTCARRKVEPRFVNKELCTERPLGWSYLYRFVLIEGPKSRRQYMVEDRQFLGTYDHY